MYPDKRGTRRVVPRRNSNGSSKSGRNLSSKNSNSYRARTSSNSTRKDLPHKKTSLRTHGTDTARSTTHPTVTPMTGNFNYHTPVPPQTQRAENTDELRDIVSSITTRSNDLAFTNVNSNESLNVNVNDNVNGNMNGIVNGNATASGYRSVTQTDNTSENQSENQTDNDCSDKQNVSTNTNDAETQIMAAVDSTTQSFVPTPRPDSNATSDNSTGNETDADDGAVSGKETMM